MKKFTWLYQLIVLVVAGIAGWNGALWVGNTIMSAVPNGLHDDLIFAWYLKDWAMPAAILMFIVTFCVVFYLGELLKKKLNF